MGDMAIQERFLTPAEHGAIIRARFTPEQAARQARLDASWDGAQNHLADPAARLRIERAMQALPDEGMTADEFRAEYRRRFGEELGEWDESSGQPRA